MTSPNEMDVGPWFLYGGLFMKYLSVCPFDCTTILGSGKVEPFKFRLTTPVGQLLSLKITDRRSVIVTL